MNDLIAQKGQPVSVRWALLALVSSLVALHAIAAEPEFNRDIRPILSENCFYCHGQDPKHREAKMRLDVREEALRDRDGVAAIVPGRPEQSEMIARLISHDDTEQMPPPESNRKVTPAQIETIRRWIANGAVYQRHWAFETPCRPALPDVKQTDWPKNEVDRFILARLEAEGLKPSKEATPEKWLRRASFDLIGLPATAQEMDAFQADVHARGESAYGAAADRLLASERFGERQAIEWLDIARYADTHGFNNDSSRSMWRWRDWVIDAFNSNKPYNQFITEQLAGDLLPDATVDQRLATGFGRNHVINSEGGIIDEEYRVEYVADRVRTTSMAWLGLTMECARCHDHKFDPILQKDYYQLFAFFNNIAEHGEDGRVANAVPLMSAPTHAQAKQLAEQQAQLAALDAKLQQASQALPSNSLRLRTAIESAPADASFTIHADRADAKEKAWTFPAKPPRLVPGVRGMAWASDGAVPLAKLEAPATTLNGKAGGTISFWLKSASNAPRDAALVSNLNHQGNPADAGFGRGTEVRLIDGEIQFCASERFPVYAMRLSTIGANLKPDQWRHIAITFTPPDPALQRTPASAIRMFVDGTELLTRIENDGLNNLPGPQPAILAADNSKDAAKWKGAIDEWRAFPRALTSAEIHSVFLSDALPFVTTRADQASAIEKQWLQNAALATGATSAPLVDQREKIWEAHLALQRAFPSTMVMAESPQPRQAYVLTRGVYELHGEPVQPGVPEKLLVPWPDGAPRNRLGLAMWFTRPDHPLTARVVINRWWSQLFGTGIVKTVEDFGSQSEWPSHPELLDWLAREFVDRGWNTKALFRKLVLSATYRQDSDVTPALVERDPENRLLARGPRVRLPAEACIRDQALAVAGLLKQRLGGPSVYPYQPENLYKGVVVGAPYPGTTWPTSHGDDLYRRSLYTFWKRTAPHPVMLTFDLPEREFCTARRSRTNTPLQALTLMNEPGMVEASRMLATRMLAEGGDADPSRIAYGFRLATGRQPLDTETRVLLTMLEKFRADYASDPVAATALIKIGASKPDSKSAPPELAATTVVASLILNLDETITKD